MKLTRRRFLGTAALTVAEAGMGFPLVSRSARAASPNEKIVVAHVGVGGMGRVHVKWFASEPDVEIAALCDVDSAAAAKALQELKAIRPDTRAVIESDFRRLLDRRDIDVIAYATPDHWHALNLILSLHAGKHVYGEKPLSRYLTEAQAMLKAWRRFGGVFQLGTQMHAQDNYHRVVELIRSGVLGKIHTVRLWKEGAPPPADLPPDSDPPATLDWDMWLGPAPARAYNPGMHPFNFRYYWDYSTGVFGDFWCHVADLPFWALGLGAPRTVRATGDDAAQHTVTTPGFMDAEFEFDGLKMLWNSHTPDIPGAQGKDLGIQFVGTKGELVADYGSRVIFLDGRQLEDIPDVPISIPRSPGHVRNFLDCVRSGGTPESNIEHAVGMTLPMYMACISYRLGRKLTWNAKKGGFEGDDEANAMRLRRYRAPWTLPG